MRIWFPLIVVPLLALADQAIASALVGWACAHQSTALLHASHAAFLAIASASAVVAWLHWRRTRPAPAGDDAATRQQHFLAGLALSVAALTALAIGLMWIPTSMISSCIA